MATKAKMLRRTVGFVVANAALGSELDTVVFLSTDGVWAAVKGEAEQIKEGAPFAPLKELIDKFQAETGITVKPTYSNNEEMIAKLRATRGAGFDLAQRFCVVWLRKHGLAFFSTG